MYRPSLWLIFCILVIDHSDLSGQHFQNYTQINYAIEDGLPSNECHRILQDSLGYIWIATDRGLVKFDGYEFETFGIKEGLLDLSCLNLLLDKNDRLWVLTLSGQIFISNKEKNHFNQYKYQNTLDSYINFYGIRDFYIDSSMVLSCAIAGRGYVVINDDGDHCEDRRSSEEDISSYYVKRMDSSLIVSTVFSINNKMPVSGLAQFDIKSFPIEKVCSVPGSEILYEEKEATENPYYIQIRNIQTGAVIKDDSSIDRSVLCLSGAGLFYQDSICIDIRPAALLDVVYHKGKYVSAEIDNRGVRFYHTYEDLAADRFYHIIPNISATDLLIDKKGDLWISTKSNGIFYHRGQDLFVFRPSSISSNISYISSGPKGLYFVANKSKLYYFEKNKKPMELFHDEFSELRSLNYFEISGELVINGFFSSTLTADHEIKPIYSNYDNNRVVTGSSRTLRFSKNDYILFNGGGFSLYKDLDGLPYLYSVDLNHKSRVLSAIKLSEGVYLLGTPSGLRIFRNEKIETIEIPKELKARINDIARIDSTYIFATQGHGLVLWDLQNEITVVGKNQGLISDNSENLFIDSKNNIYVSSNAGLSKVFHSERDSLIVKNYTSFHGLPSNEVNNVTEYNDTIYIATNKGIAILADNSTLSTKQTIRIESLSVNGMLGVDYQELSSSENNIEVSYRTLDYRLLSKINYRYRLNDNGWTGTQSTYVNFPSLQPGSYNFHVQSQNRDGVWSDSAIIEFKVNHPWWRTWWFYTLSICGIGFLGYAYYKRRTGFLQNKIEVEREIRDLERAALQAQMNPHFIFNCLNSIQGFIMKNEKEEAMEYLARFAKLIRGNLNASSENLITLDQEIQMLDNYLALEQLRSDNTFQYQIEIDPQLDELTTRIPPMLIQPFIENAVLHGMKALRGKGKIEVEFKKRSDSELLVNIQDNGSGMNGKLKSKHKSFGMQITNKRLAHIQEQLTNTYQVNSSETGTQIEFIIPF